MNKRTPFLWWHVLRTWFVCLALTNFVKVLLQLYTFSLQAPTTPMTKFSHVKVPTLIFPLTSQHVIYMCESLHWLISKLDSNIIHSTLLHVISLANKACLCHLCRYLHSRPVDYILGICYEQSIINQSFATVEGLAPYLN